MLELLANILETCKNARALKWAFLRPDLRKSSRWKLRAMIIWTRILSLVKFEPTDCRCLGFGYSHTICDQDPKR